MDFNENLSNLMDVLFNASKTNNQQTEMLSINKFKKFVKLRIDSKFQMKLIGIFSDFYNENKADLDNLIKPDGSLNNEILSNKEIISHVTTKSTRLPIGSVYSKSGDNAKLKIAYFLYSVLSTSINENENILRVIEKVENLIADESDDDDKNPFDMNNFAERMSELTESCFGQKIDTRSIQDTVSNLIGKDKLDGLMKGFEKSSKDLGSGKPITEIFNGLFNQFKDVVDTTMSSSSSKSMPMLEDKTDESNE